MSSKRVTLIHNPGAGDERQPSAGQLQALIEEAGYKVRYQSSKENGWAKTLKRSADIIAVAGGDGTVGKVARRLIGSGVPIGVLPVGTANNISRTLGIAELPITQLIPSWEKAYRLSFDAGVARGPWGERYFIEGVGAGLLTNAIPKVDNSRTLPQLPQTEVKLSYAQQLIREHATETKPLEIRATLDGSDVSGRYLLFEIMNMQYIGPNLFLAPGVARNSGDFDLVLVQEEHRSLLHEHIRNWQDGKLFPSEFKTLRGRKLELEWTGFRLHIDDKLWPIAGKKKPKSPAPVEVQVVPDALRLLIPAEVHEAQAAARPAPGA
jgi:diacylglycerol kinase (ATP)